MDPFAPNLHFELPDSDNYLFTVRERGEARFGRGAEGRVGGGRGRSLRMIEIVFNAGGVFCMAMVGRGD